MSPEVFNEFLKQKIEFLFILFILTGYQLPIVQLLCFNVGVPQLLSERVHFPDDVFKILGEGRGRVVIKPGGELHAAGLCVADGARVLLEELLALGHSCGVVDGSGISGNLERFFKGGARVVFIVLVLPSLLAFGVGGGLTALAADVGGDCLLVGGRVGETVTIGGRITGTLRFG